ncbi:general transcription factor 3C polypeptide 5-like [Lineus longissimus]|uniref:general transcription factor 3C polypeptide 5-like n=1 Tax=Lineus longissimus TaxID=88925 RepID=UPI00315C7536
MANDFSLKVPVKTSKLVCVEYPGIVKNVDRMLETLGGIRSVSRVVADQTRRLGVSFRPGDCYCKSAYADRFSSVGFVMKVRRKKVKGQESGQEEFKYDAEVVGIVDTMFKFEALMDFQYLPMMRTKQDTYKSIRDQLVISKLEHSSWIQKPAPLFLLPPLFSRIDQSVLYMYRPDKQFGRVKTADGAAVLAKEEHTIGLGRQRRTHFTTLVKWENDIPLAPNPEAIEKLMPKVVKEMDKVDELRKMFEIRPIWSKNAIRSNIDCMPTKLKFYLPFVAYYYLTGPWRAMWVRYGYDPKTDKTAKRLQTIDFRIRQRVHGEKLPVRCKRKTFSYTLPSHIQKRNLTSVSVLDKETIGSKPDCPKTWNDQDCVYKFRPGVKPPYRQMFYQICDVEVPEIQALVAKNDGKETECSEKDGWLEKDATYHCRDILTSHVDTGDNKDPYSHLEKPYKKKPPSERKQKLKMSGTGLSDSESDGEIEEPGEDEEINEMETELLDLIADVAEDSPDET